MSLLTLDIEASALEHGYPIEVAVADVGARQVKAWLIRPFLGWAILDWEDESEAIHKLTTEIVQSRGEPIEKIVEEMSAFIDGRYLCSDNPRFDARLLAMLFKVAACPVPVVDNKSSGAAFSLLAHDHGRSPADIAAVNLARKEMANHTAAGDAASWAAAAEALALAGDLSIERIDDVFGRWDARARIASPWRLR